MPHNPKQPLLPQPPPMPSNTGQWQAWLGNQLIALGPTAEAARAQAQTARPRETATLLYTPNLPTPSDIELPELVQAIRPHLPNPAEVWLVGGAVRDLLRHRPVYDIDLVVAADAPRIARNLANTLPDAAYYLLDAQRGTARIVLNWNDQPHTIDIANLRAENLPGDLLDRDFTINAMALSLADEPQFLDIANGVNDLKEKMLRPLTPTALQSDPVRALRAVRLALQLGFRMHPTTTEQARSAAALFPSLSAERIRDEFFKILAGPNPAAGLRTLHQLGLLAQVIPEVSAMDGQAQSEPHTQPVLDHTFNTIAMLDRVLGVLGRVHNVDSASSYALGLVSARIGNFRQPLNDRLERQLSAGRSVRGLLFLAAMLHDCGKPAVATLTDAKRLFFPMHEGKGADLSNERLTALRFSKLEAQWVATVVRHHARPQAFSQRSQPLTDRHIHRYFRSTETCGPEIVLLTIADRLALFGPSLPPTEQTRWADFINRMVELLDGYFLRYDTVINPPPLLTGDDLIAELGLTPGPKIGELLDQLREAQAVGEISTRDQALAFATNWLKHPPSGSDAVRRA